MARAAVLRASILQGRAKGFPGARRRAGGGACPVAAAP